MAARKIIGAAVLTGLFMATAIPASAEVGLGADLVSRYIFRGVDFGNSAAVQPYLSVSQEVATGTLEVGAWGSFSITGVDAITTGSADENDLYATYSTGSVSVTLTDYYFPGAVGSNDFFDYDDESGSHILEIMGTVDFEVASVTGAFNFLGDGEDSIYLEVGVPLTEVEGVALSLTGIAGNGVYTTDTDFAFTAVGIGASKDSYSATYILNTDSELAFLVFGMSF